MKRCPSKCIVDPNLIERIVRCVWSAGHQGPHAGYHTSRGVITWPRKKVTT